MNEIKIRLQKDFHSIVTALASTIQLATSNVHIKAGTICKSHLNQLNNNLKDISEILNLVKVKS